MFLDRNTLPLPGDPNAPRGDRQILIWEEEMSERGAHEEVRWKMIARGLSYGAPGVIAFFGVRVVLNSFGPGEQNIAALDTIGSLIFSLWSAKVAGSVAYHNVEHRISEKKRLWDLAVSERSRRFQGG